MDMVRSKTVMNNDLPDRGNLDQLRNTFIASSRCRPGSTTLLSTPPPDRLVSRMGLAHCAAYNRGTASARTALSAGRGYLVRTAAAAATPYICRALGELHHPPSQIGKIDNNTLAWRDLEWRGSRGVSEDADYMSR